MSLQSIRVSKQSANAQLHLCRLAHPEILFQTTLSSSSALYFPLLTAFNASPSEIQASGSNVSSSSTSGNCLGFGGVDLIDSGIKCRFPFCSHNRFVEFSGVTQEGRTFAASIKRNSPSVSRILSLAHTSFAGQDELTQ
jgi:hypothetical protein